MAEIKISDLTPKGANLTVTDLLVVSEDIGGGLYETKSITGDEVLNAVAKTTVAVRNQTGVTIYKGTIVYISGASGGKALISKAQANSEATSSKTLGVVTADIANNANGNVLTNGLLTLLDTRTAATHPFTADTLAIGDDLYLSPITAGYVTNVKPIAPNNLVNIGKVLETSATTGQILYAIVNGYELGELHDVDTTGAVSGNVLALNGGIWKPTVIETNSNPSVISLDITDGATVTGTTVDTLSKSMLIPANTFTGNGMLEIITRAFKTGSAGNATIRIYLNTSSTLTGATLIATLANTNTQFFQSIRNMSIFSNNLSSIQANTATLSDFSIAGAISTTTFTVTNSYFLLFAIQLANSADSAVIKLARSTKYI